MAEKIRILHISLTDTYGGIAAYQKSVLASVDTERYRLEFVSPYSNAVLIPFIEEKGSCVHIIPAEKTIFPYFWALYKVMKDGKFDAVHIHKNSLVNSLPFFAAKLAGVKTIIAHSHNTSPSTVKKLRFLHYLFRPLVRKISTVHLACSDAASDWLFGKNHPAEVMKNGIDLQKFAYDAAVRREVRAELGIENELLIGHVGNFFYQKNHRFMVEIMAAMKEICPEAKMLFAGEGSTFEETKRYACELGVEDSILFLGARKDAHRLYQAMDVFLLPSFSEGFPFVGLEAQAADLPFLMSDKVPAEIMLTEDCYVMSLTQSPSDWAEKLCKIAQGKQRKSSCEALARLGYDVKESAKLIEKHYAGVGRSCKENCK